MSAPKVKTYRVTLRYLVTLEVEAPDEQAALEAAHFDALSEGECETLDEQVECIDEGDAR